MPRESDNPFTNFKPYFVQQVYDHNFKHVLKNNFTKHDHKSVVEQATTLTSQYFKGLNKVSAEVTGNPFNWQPYNFFKRDCCKNNPWDPRCDVED